MPVNASLNTASKTTQLETLSSSQESQSLESVSSGGIVIVGAGMAGSRLAIKLATAMQNEAPLQSKNSTFESFKTNSDQNNNSTPNPNNHSNSINLTNSTNFSNSDHTSNSEAAPLITLISKESQVGYNRIMLSPVLAGEKLFDDTYLYDKGDYERLGIKVMAGVCVDEIDTVNQRLTFDNGQVIRYTKLVLATGSTARVIPFPNHDAKGVHVFRDVADVTLLTEYAKQGKTGLVIGGGVLGLEAACALKSQGANMTVIHVDGYVLNRQLDLSAAEMLQDELALRDVGLEVLAMSTTIEKNDAGEVTGLSLKDGRTLPADFIVMAVGIIPNTKLAADSGITVNRAIVVDEFMQTDCDNVYAIGECIEINEELFGMVSSINQHVDTLISVLMHPNDQSQWQSFVSVPLSLKLKVSGIAVFSAGQIEFSEEETKDVEQIVYRRQGNSSTSDHYQCLYLKNNKLVGAVLYGETSEGSFYSQLINDKTDISAIKDDLIYGSVFCSLEEDENTDDNDDREVHIDNSIENESISSVTPIRSSKDNLDLNSTTTFKDSNDKSTNTKSHSSNINSEGETV